MMNYIRRRFSSSDIQKDLENEEQSMSPASFFNFGSGKKGPSPSVPSSPSKTIQNITGNISGSVAGVAKGLLNKANMNKDRCKFLLVIDDHHTDWSKYFRGRKILGDFDLRVEQAEFDEINVTANGEAGCIVTIQQSGSRSSRSFKPDFVLIRQHQSKSRYWKHVVMGLRFGGVAGLNSLESVYNMVDKPWTFSHLLRIQHKLGKDNFPLIEQAFVSSHRELTSPSKYPVVIKVDNANEGIGKIRVNNLYEFQDIASMVSLVDSFVAIEPFYDCKYDIHIQKLGQSYKAFMRKSISDNWKANVGSSMLEQISITERWKCWIDEVSQLFGGLDMCAIQAIQTKDGRQYILEAKGSTLSLIGDSQEEDRRLISDLVIQKMSHHLKARSASQVPNLQNDGGTTKPKLPHMNPVPAPRPPQLFPGHPNSDMQNMPPRGLEGPPRPDPMPPQRNSADRTEEIIRDLQEEDTMSNLKKTFAGIFGDI